MRFSKTKGILKYVCLGFLLFSSISVQAAIYNVAFDGPAFDLVGTVELNTTGTFTAIAFDDVVTAFSITATSAADVRVFTDSNSSFGGFFNNQGQSTSITVTPTEIQITSTGSRFANGNYPSDLRFLVTNSSDAPIGSALALSRLNELGFIVFGDSSATNTAQAGAFPFVLATAAANSAPTANDDSGAGFTTNQNAAFTTGNVLSNDTDPDSDVLSVIAVDTNVTTGFVFNNGDGTFIYNPFGHFDYLAEGESTTTSFSYTVSDGNGGTDTALVTITITGVNDAPTANNDGGAGYTTDEDTAFSAGNVLSNDTDPDTGDVLSVSAMNTAGTTGSVINNGNGTFAYDPNGQFESLAAGESTTDSFGYTVSDGNGGTNTAVVTITINGVNDDPTANDDSGAGFTTNQNASFNTGNVLSNDTDPDTSDVLSVIALDTNVTTGFVYNNGDGTFIYNPFGHFDYLAEGESTTTSFSYTVSDGNGGTDTALVTITITGVNDAPTANNDGGAGYTTDEDTAFSAGNVLSNDTDPDTGDVLSVSAMNTAGTTGSVINNGNGTFAYDPNGQFEYLGTGDVTTDSFDYTVSDGNGGTDTATVTITINGVNDAPVMVVNGVAPATQISDYSDHIGQVSISATDIDSPTSNGDLTLSLSGAPSDIPNPGLNSTAACDDVGEGQSCSWTMDGQVEVAAALFDIDFTANDGEADSVCSGVTGTCRHELTVIAEMATVLLDSGNAVAVQVETDGGDSGSITLMFSAWEDGAADTAHVGSPDYGDLNYMVPVMSLVPVGPGGPIEGDCAFIAPLPASPGSGYGDTALFECDFDEVPVNTYEVLASVDGGYYIGSDDAVLVVFDPSLGFTTGGGWFYWPGTADPELLTCGEDGYAGDKTNFGFNMKYNKKRTNIQGSLLMMRHTVDANCEDAGKYRVKSNALDGLSIGDGTDADGDYGWAAFSGKSVFSEPGLDGSGNHPFLVYVEDHTDEGGNQDPVDEFWIQVKDKDGNVVLETNGPDSDPAGDDPATDGDDVSIENGNIIVPHGGGGGGGKGGKK